MKKSYALKIDSPYWKKGTILIKSGMQYRPVNSSMYSIPAWIVENSPSLFEEILEQEAIPATTTMFGWQQPDECPVTGDEPELATKFLEEGD